jgi:hypothetical protein
MSRQGKSSRVVIIMDSLLKLLSLEVLKFTSFVLCSMESHGITDISAYSVSKTATCRAIDILTSRR